MLHSIKEYATSYFHPQETTLYCAIQKLMHKIVVYQRLTQIKSQ